MYYDGQVHIEEDDQCFNCRYFVKDIACPLLEALAVGVAHLDGDVQVKNCGFYVAYKRHLQLVEPETDLSTPTTKSPEIPGEDRLKMV